MRRHMISVLGLLGIVLLASVSASLLVAQTPDSPEVMLEAARQLEVIDGNLEAAIEQYSAIESRYPDRRAIVAQALLRMGSAYEKLGQVGDAREEYERLVREYPGQAEAVAAAQARLEPPASPTMTVREVMRSGEQQPGDIQAVPGPGSPVTGDGQMFIYTDWPPATWRR